MTKPEGSPEVKKILDHIAQAEWLKREGKHEGIPAQDVIEGDTTYTQADREAGLKLFGGGKVFKDGKAKPSE